jgi:hypothetical protein
MGMKKHDDATSSKPGTMATQEGNGLIGGTMEKPPVQRDKDMAEAGEASGAAVQRSRKTIPVSFAAAREQ